MGISPGFRITSMFLALLSHTPNKPLTIHPLRSFLSAPCRQYCADEPALATAVAFLDDEGAAGWGLMAALVNGSAPAAALVDSTFCQL